MNYRGWAEWYDIAYETAGNRGVAFYVEQARERGGPVLEIGVGTGRIAIPTALAGIDVTGIDLNRPMLDAARRKIAAEGDLAGRVELIEADMRSLDLGRTFPLVTAPARVLLLAMTAEEQQQTLDCIARHVEPDGRFIFNVFVPDQQLINSDNGSPYLFAEGVNPSTGNAVLMWNVNRFDLAAQTNHGFQVFEEIDEHGATVRKATLAVNTRYLYPSEIHEMIEQAGMHVESVYGDFDESPFDEDSSEQIFVCRPAG